MSSFAIRRIFVALAALALLAVSCKKDEPKGKYGVDGVTPMPEAVDLGLATGLKWASFNLGASKEYQHGDYFAWGETATKDNYDWASYKWCTGAADKLTKYCPKYEADKWDAVAKPEGPDGRVKLIPEDDVAHVKLGGKWRMPTNEDFEELFALETEAAKENSDYTWEKWVSVTNDSGYKVYGIRIKRKSTGATLFLPAVGYLNGVTFSDGYGMYWSSSLNESDPGGAYDVSFHSGGAGRNIGSRYHGQSIRPVSV